MIPTNHIFFPSSACCDIFRVLYRIVYVFVYCMSIVWSLVLILTGLSIPYMPINPIYANQHPNSMCILVIILSLGLHRHGIVQCRSRVQGQLMLLSVPQATKPFTQIILSFLFVTIVFCDNMSVMYSTCNLSATSKNQIYENIFIFFLCNIEEPCVRLACFISSSVCKYIYKQTSYTIISILSK